MEDLTGPDHLRRLGLTADRALSDDGDSFVTLACHDRSGTPLVLKYVKADAPADAHRRLDNEATLFRTLRATAPLRLLRHEASGKGFLVTAMSGGRLLRPAAMGDPRVLDAVARALTVLHATPVAHGALRRREHTGVYYLKVMAKHVLHLWPDHLNAASACRALAIVSAALPAILGRSVVTHGDFLPTNLLFHDDDGSVTITDLEGAFLNHPLFDVLALFTSDERAIDAWDWQGAFLARYLENTAGVARLDSASRRFWDAYRGILVFFLVYRLNEARIYLEGGRYFDGLPKWTFLRRKLARFEVAPARGGSAAALADRRSDMTRMLVRDELDRHVERMQSLTMPPAV